MFIYDEQNPDLETSTGYAVEITKIISKKLNFSTVLVPTTGFGSWKGNGWSGMVGQLDEEVRH